MSGYSFGGHNKVMMHKQLNESKKQETFCLCLKIQQITMNL